MHGQYLIRHKCLFTHCTFPSNEVIWWSFALTGDLCVCSECLTVLTPLKSTGNTFFLEKLAVNGRQSFSKFSFIWHSHFKGWVNYSINCPMLYTVKTTAELKAESCFCFCYELIFGSRFFSRVLSTASLKIRLGSIPVIFTTRKCTKNSQQIFKASGNCAVFTYRAKNLLNLGSKDIQL